MDFDEPRFEGRKHSYFESTPPATGARVLFMQDLGDRLKGSRVVANSVRPGVVAWTQLPDRTGGISRWFTDTFGSTPENGADAVVWLATAPVTETVTGKLWGRRKELKTSGQGSGPEARKRSWAETERLVAASSNGAASKR